MFGSDRQADGVWLDAGGSQFCFIHLGMGGRCGMDDKAFDIGNICKQRKDLQAVNKFVGLPDAALDFKGKDAPP